jgi:hypothetical protein
VELACGPLKQTEFSEEISFVCEVCGRASDSIDVMPGWASEVPDAQLWKPNLVPAAGLIDSIAGLIASGAFRPGRSDLHISSGPLEVTFCHEEDIHVVTADLAILSECVTRWLERGRKIHRKLKMAGQGWKEVGSVDEVISALAEGD